MENDKTTDVPKIIFKFPTLRERFIGVILDNVTILLCFLIVSYISNEIIEISTNVKPFIFFGLLFLYEPIMTTFFCTVGQIFMGFRVRKINDEDSKISLVQGFARLLLKYSLGWLSFLTVTFNEKNRAIHDLVSGTIAINKSELK
jgi:uncharacterized RDD family membrane protein YckC